MSNHWDRTYDSKLGLNMSAIKFLYWLSKSTHWGVFNTVKDNNSVYFQNPIIFVCLDNSLNFGFISAKTLPKNYGENNYDSARSHFRIWLYELTFAVFHWNEFERRIKNVPIIISQMTKTIQYNFRYQRWRIALWQNLDNCLSIIGKVDVIHFRLVSCFVFQPMRSQDIDNATREWAHKTNTQLKYYFSSWNGETFQTEPSTTFTHRLTNSLGSYRDSPFITGSFGEGLVPSGLETEILDYASGTWDQAEDYPFSENDRYVLLQK